MLALVLASIAAAAPSGPSGPVTVLFAGDVTLGYHYEEYVETLVKQGTPRDEAVGWGFAQVGERTRAADLFVVNLECPFTTREERLPKNFNFRASPALAPALAVGGVDVVSLANNHLVDYGPGGIADTQAALESVHVASFGAGRTLAEARAPRVVTVKGVRFAFLGAFFLGEKNLEPREVIATAETAGVAGHHSSEAAMTEMIVADVRAAKARADHVVVFFHWGRETQAEPEPYQVRLAHAAVEAGASAIVGSHPHVLQGLERWKGAPVAYSLGNFVFGGNWDPKDKRTALLELTFDAQRVLDTKVLPARSDAYPERPVQPFFATDAGALEVLALLGERSQAFPEPLVPVAARDGGPFEKASGRAPAPDAGTQEMPGRQGLRP